MSLEGKRKDRFLVVVNDNVVCSRASYDGAFEYARDRYGSFPRINQSFLIIRERKYKNPKNNNSSSKK